MYGKDFRIIGQIGEEGQNDRFKDVGNKSDRLKPAQDKPEQLGEGIPSYDHLRYPPLAHLTSEQQLEVKKMLLEESDVFACDDRDTGCIPDLQMAICLKDDIPVTKT